MGLVRAQPPISHRSSFDKLKARPAGRETGTIIAMVSRAVIFAVLAGATACHAFVPFVAALGKPLALRRISFSISTRGERATSRPSILRINAGLWNYFRAQKSESYSTKGRFKFETIRDNFKSIQEVQQALRAAGLESSNLIVGIDFTKSNMWTGEKSFDGRCLHDTTGPINPYQQVIGIVGRTLEAFDDDHLIPAFGFGNTITKDKSCFPFFPGRPCVGLSELLDRYKQIAPGYVAALATTASRAVFTRGRPRQECC